MSKTNEAVAAANTAAAYYRICRNEASRLAGIHSAAVEAVAVASLGYELAEAEADAADRRTTNFRSLLAAAYDAESHRTHCRRERTQAAAAALESSTVRDRAADAARQLRHTAKAAKRADAAERAASPRSTAAAIVASRIILPKRAAAARWFGPERRALAALAAIGFGVRSLLARRLENTAAALDA